MHSPVVSFQEGIVVVAKRILSYNSEQPYIATIRGMPQVGKTHFGRGVIEKLYYQKQGTLVKPHDLEREISQKKLEYVLLEIDQFDSPYDMLIDTKTKNLYGKVPDTRILVVHDLEPLLGDLPLDKVLQFFDLVVENDTHPKPYAGITESLNRKFGN